jgi:large subunit ribosomal protein L19e
MRLTNQKTIASKVLKCSPDRVWVAPERIADVKEAVTRQDIKALISDGLIAKKQKTGQSRVRARLRLIQRRKGRRKGQGSRKGKKTARGDTKKTLWINKIRVQRKLIRELKTKKLIDVSTYQILLARAKGGFFRSQRHIKLYVGEKNLIQTK